MAQTADEPKTSSEPGSSVTMPGRMITRAPAKPATSAAMRRMRTASPSSSTAPTVTKSGAVKLSAAMVPSGVIGTAKKNISMAETWTAPRAAWSGSRRVRSAPKPWRSSKGAMKTRPKRLRKNATSKGCCSVEAMRITACIDAKPMVAPSSSSMPRAGGGRAP